MTVKMALRRKRLGRQNAEFLHEATDFQESQLIALPSLCLSHRGMFSRAPRSLLLRSGK